eukprot:1863120-Amphidinium_carterae.1
MHVTLAGTRQCLGVFCFALEVWCWVGLRPQLPQLMIVLPTVIVKGARRATQVIATGAAEEMPAARQPSQHQNYVLRALHAFFCATAQAGHEQDPPECKRCKLAACSASSQHVATCHERQGLRLLSTISSMCQTEQRRRRAGRLK